MKRKPHRREATPVAHMILSKRMADHRPHDMICELVDNALDAGAQRVWIELGRRAVTVADDGSGMEDINDAIRFGKGTRAGRKSGVLGRYGVGMTDALCKLGPRAEVATLRDGGMRRLRVDWEECLRGGHFPYLEESRPRRCAAIEHPDGSSSASGTRVRIHGQAPGVHLDKLCRLLTERYTPGIWQGREILARREAQGWTPIEDMDPGALHDVIEYDGEIDGRPYHVYGGLMEERSVVYNRAFVGYAYRFVEETTELVKGLSTAHLQVFLGEEWGDCLGTHKNRLERGREELFEDIRSRAKDWLDGAARKAEALQLTNLALELEDYLKRMEEASGSDAVVPAHRRTASRERARREGGERQPRPTEGTAGGDRSARPRRGIQIAWDPALRQMGELRVGDDGDVSVALNPDDARIRALRERRDCPGLVHIITAYVAQYAALGDDNARRVLRPGIVRAADPGLREHELYAYYYDRVDQPAVAHEDG
jgi:Histidine kinase-, DNA gyrase B-, and HSP90-like ATPase